MSSLARSFILTSTATLLLGICPAAAQTTEEAAPPRPAMGLLLHGRLLLSQSWTMAAEPDGAVVSTAPLVGLPPVAVGWAFSGVSLALGPLWEQASWRVESPRVVDRVSLGGELVASWTVMSLAGGRLEGYPVVSATVLYTAADTDVGPVTGPGGGVSVASGEIDASWSYGFDLGFGARHHLTPWLAVTIEAGLGYAALPVSYYPDGPTIQDGLGVWGNLGLRVVLGS